MLKKVGFGGGCHWCTEAVFSALKGVETVEQGWIASGGDYSSFSEGVIVSYNALEISPDVLIEIHLHTHASTADHSMRDKYRSAVYTFDDSDIISIQIIIDDLQNDFDKPIITKVLPFADFKLNREDSLNYYFSDPAKPFCENYINPKLKLLREQFSKVTRIEKLVHLK
jgi:peptide-methionine (S)-S-oxide reductase